MKEKAGLYIHIPFCRSKCPYCDFYSIASPSLLSRFIEALKRELQYYKGRFESFDTIYIGGGTPSIVSEDQIEDLMKYLTENIRLDHDFEITIEVNPCDISMEKARFLASIGINRVSLGCQSFDDDILKLLGRRHTSRDAVKAFDLLRKAGFENISIDLIYAIPGQELSDWFCILKKAVSISPEHISCYELTFSKGTPFWKRLKRGEFSEMDEDAKAMFFIKTSEFLESRGYIHYEISNFAREERYFSRHNQKYWLHVPYLGLGPSAHSFDGRKRWWNISSVRRYCEAMETGEPAWEEIEELSEEQIRIEKIFLGLRTRYGIERKVLGNVPEDILKELQRDDLLRIQGNRIIPTRKGFSVADQLTSYLV